MCASVVTQSRIPPSCDATSAKDRLSRVLDIHLCASPSVIDFGPDPESEIWLESSPAPPGSIARRVALLDRILIVVAIPGTDGAASGLRRTLARRSGTRDLLVVRQVWLMRQPRLDILSTLTAYSDVRVAPIDWIRVEQHLVSAGGTSDLGDCAACIVLEEDPVRAVLALVAQHRLHMDCSRPLSAFSLISLPGHGSRSLVGG